MVSSSQVPGLGGVTEEEGKIQDILPKFEVVRVGAPLHWQTRRLKVSHTYKNKICNMWEARREKEMLHIVLLLIINKLKFKGQEVEHSLHKEGKQSK